MAKIILIDMGHSKVDPLNGKYSPDRSFYEWEWTRLIGRQIICKLVSLGYDARPVVYPSEDSIKVTPTERANRVNEVCTKYGTANVMLVSIHSNAAGNGSQWMSARGWSVFVSKNSSYASKTLAGCIFDEIAKEGFKMRQPLPNQKYWEENFTVVYKTKCKAVLTESLFYDNKEDLAMLKDPVYQSKIVDGHVNGIIKYLG